MSCIIQTDQYHYLQKYLGPSVMTANYLGGILNSLGIHNCIHNYYYDDPLFANIYSVWIHQ